MCAMAPMGWIAEHDIYDSVPFNLLPSTRFISHVVAEPSGAGCKRDGKRSLPKG